MFNPNVSQYSLSALLSSQTSRPSEFVNSNYNNSGSFAVKGELLEQKKEGMERILARVEEDKDFAHHMVEVYRSTPDRPLFNLAEALSSPLGLSQLQEKTNQFNDAASKISIQREELYNSLRSRNHDDSAIFKALMEFNNSLPSDYKQAAGIVRVDTQA